MDTQTWSNWIEFMLSTPIPTPWIDCQQWSRWVDFLKAAGPTIGIFGAVAAWLINKLLSWSVWEVESFLKRYELMKALLAEIESNSHGEQFYYPGLASPQQPVPMAETLIDSLRAQLGPYKPLAPYVPTVSGNPVYESAVATLSLLPGRVVKPIVRYYSASTQLVGQLADFRHDAYLALDQTRQATVIRQLWRNIGSEVEISAKLAKRRLKVWIVLYEFIRYAIVFFALIIGTPPAIWLAVNWRSLPADIANAVTPVVGMVQSCPLPSPSGSN